ncbi:cyclopropane-fatty-acyl-phospholipid synthase family protein [Pseudonocardia sp. DSM 110487]|uniref:SAM-dependent methyltransferase n=1 Tax=Pseudonocardia sp. DSM 110487 TaxID=2865833 RepID=UPI002103717D|nr:class I SAM-dependent methyltransferase [Pseudonocardia sp. DSM 110487]
MTGGLTPSIQAAWRTAHGGLLRVLQSMGVRQPEAAIESASQRYWTESHHGRGSHWKSTARFAEGDLWTRIGVRHLGMLRRAARLLDAEPAFGRVVEWGCGGGANAVQIAPVAREFIGVDVSSESLQECARQVTARCDTPFRPVLVDVRDPEAALRDITEPCDVFLCVYVFELIPSPAYGERILHIAQELLAPGGLALVQIKYDTGAWRTRPRRLSYRFSPGNTTTYPIHDFWELAVRCGFEPRYVELVPEDELDERYAYFVMMKPDIPGGAMSSRSSGRGQAIRPNGTTSPTRSAPSDR